MPSRDRLLKNTAKPTEVNVSAPIAQSLSSGAPFRALVVGSLADVPRALEHPAVGSRSRFDVVCVLPLHEDGLRVPRAEICGLVTANAADTILVAGPISRNAMDELGELAVTLACRLLVVMPAPVPRLHDPVIVWEGEHPLIQLAVVSDNGVRNVLKRAFDITMSATLLALSAPIVAVAAIAVRLTSEGGAFFGHERVGRGGRRFLCWKIRTMAADAEDRLRADPALHESYRKNSYKLPEHSDPRVTSVGHFLRQASIDELPQLWNVLKGDMSLVGPRPLIADELHHYTGSVLTLLSVRPGLTGAWAVNGRHRLHYPRRAEIELHYVRNCSLRYDLVILFRTAAAIIDFSSDAT
ncbi:MAG: sugar transferase [Gemmatimonadota bacterium]|nr:sugar transferase [Gemmatimonadota bacterium]